MYVTITATRRQVKTGTVINDILYSATIGYINVDLKVVKLQKGRINVAC